MLFVNVDWPFRNIERPANYQRSTSGKATACREGLAPAPHVHTVYLVVCASMGCILPLPATAVYEPNYEAGAKSTR